MFNDELLNQDLKEQKIFRSIIVVAFVIYIGMLLKFILLKNLTVTEFYWTSMENQIIPISKHMINLLPFKTIYAYISNDMNLPTIIIVENLIGKIALFLPFGFLVPIIAGRRVKVFKLFIMGLLLCFSIEAMQLLTRTGMLDVDDLMLNMIGIILGFSLFKIINRKVRNHKKGYTTNWKYMHMD